MNKHTALNCALVFFSLAQNLALSQVSSGSLVMVSLTKTKVIVVGDSRIVQNDATHKLPPFDGYCKISALGNDVIFTAVNSMSFDPSRSDPVPPWNAFTEARRAFNAAKTIKDGGARLNAMTKVWTESTVRHFLRMVKFHPDYLIPDDGKLTEAVFIIAAGGRFLYKGPIITLDGKNVGTSLIPHNVTLLFLRWAKLLSLGKYGRSKAEQPTSPKLPIFQPSE